MWASIAKIIPRCRRTSRRIVDAAQRQILPRVAYPVGHMVAGQGRRFPGFSDGQCGAENRNGQQDAAVRARAQRGDSGSVDRQRGQLGGVPQVLCISQSHLVSGQAVDLGAKLTGVPAKSHLSWQE